MERKHFPEHSWVYFPVILIKKFHFKPKHSKDFVKKVNVTKKREKNNFKIQSAIDIMLRQVKRTLKLEPKWFKFINVLSVKARKSL